MHHTNHAFSKATNSQSPQPPTVNAFKPDHGLDFCLITAVAFLRNSSPPRMAIISQTEESARRVENVGWSGIGT
jgi:hypothetical protein